MLVPLDVLERSSAELLGRLETEAARLGNASTTLRLGGMAKVGSKLEAFLRCVFSELAAGEGVEPEVLLQQLTSKPRAKMHRATAGELARALSDRSSSPAAALPRVRAVIDDVCRPESCISAFIRLRNALIHSSEGQLPPSISQVVLQLLDFVATYRAAQGWATPPPPSR